MTADYEPSGDVSTDSDKAPAEPVQRSIMGELAHFFTAMARVFSDPEVQKAGDNFMSAMDKAGARELGMPRLRMLDAPTEGDKP